MAGLFTLVLAAVVSLSAPPADVQPHGAQVRAVATVTILRAESASESAGPGGLTRHISRHSDGSASILFE
ncbi:MAG: hypothetical protein WBL74_09395 [Novosphingobium sp.]|uniref:hypothetical protein n=1 Tax=Novosphingobium sp. TaxID=1874826 RepID=UPI003C7DD129